MDDLPRMNVLERHADLYEPLKDFLLAKLFTTLLVLLYVIGQVTD